ncbi:GYDIA family GHMP kinase [Tenacibaculum sp. IB213877]|uniref:GYDIA family GHMP kinase n=1 Tax=Tenacibaculum sp. IB213877 TaxID=3097351 RepID=UPI002A5ADAF6|nr:GYDIA family GHMP kinase [Tenacibaculum sp. IB213877]MDY0780701.1 GYDIA family GHMP kinase [Tenacibaculum sp. IB213877]
MRFYSNGKLLLTGEYVVLDGAKSLAIPTEFGQDLVVEPIKEPQLIWGSFTNEGTCWFEASFDLPKLRLTSATFNSDKEGSAEFIAETLQNILLEARKLSREFGTDFLQTESGFVVKTNLTFPQNWGLGSSSTLINNIASWANVNRFDLLWNAFSGSGYDIACAQNNSPIFYQLEDKKPKIETIDFNPSFADELFFIHLNQKQNSREGIAQYRKYQKERPLDSALGDINDISTLSDEFVNAKSANDLNKIIVEHERIISSIIKLDPVKNNLFSDYFGEVKSLGAWGGDFVLATGNSDTPKYFKEKGFNTILNYKEMVKPSQILPKGGR